MTKKQMERTDLLRRYLPVYDRIFSADGGSKHELNGLGVEERLLFAVAAVKEEGKKVLWVVETEEQAKNLRTEARRFLNSLEVGVFPARDRVPMESVAVNAGREADRIRVLAGLNSDRPFLAIAACDALTRRVLPPQVWRDAETVLNVGDRYSLDALALRLSEVGYRRESLTEDHGCFSVRGGVVDVFPPASARPYRIDFFDDEIESIRVFDPEGQVSLGTVKQARIGPGNSFFILDPFKGNGIRNLLQEEKRRRSKMRETPKKRCLERIGRLKEYLTEGAFLDFTEQLLPHFYDEVYLEDHLGDDALIIVDEAAAIGKALEKEDEDLAVIFEDLLCAGDILPSYVSMFRNKERVFGALDGRSLLYFSYLPGAMGPDVVAGDAAMRAFHFYRPVEERGDELAALTEKGEVWFCVSDDAGKARVEGLIELKELKNCRVVLLPLAQSIELYDVPLYLIAAGDLSHDPQREAKPRRQKKGRPISSFVDLKVGDYVVHETHGIGRYMGIERLLVEVTERDYLKICYAGTDKLYIPTDQMDMLQKYIGNDGPVAPRLNRLGGKDWKNTKEKVRESVREMATELVKLYAARSKAPGFAFSPDSEWQREMEAEFPYEETPDQLEAIAAVKADMESDRPMDRLLCGDVGYGKTEVALRAAFKAVNDGKQVAILAPTTLLVQQHERTFHERLDRFDVKIAAMSRLKDGDELEQVKKDLAAGDVDIVIGTHKLFTEDVVFKDLGLLVIDEEQRFGVGQKEKLKQRHENVDILAMSATPIPRTLHMSLIGVRDISIIETPPKDRRPVETYVMEYNSMLMREAIVRELERGGQVYYIHNRVDDLKTVAASIRSYVPDAKVFLAHGRMAEKSMAKTMLGFLAGEANLLLSTTIVENGIDLPNVNTLIVDDADHYGLSQMYQLRGRVGRGSNQAFAYFFYPRGRLLKTPAQKRLAAIRDYTDLGSGFKIAMRDMEIRGVGNILGAEQHGHVATVGFDMYCRLIEEEVGRLNGEPEKKPKEELPIEILCSAYLPEDYVGDGDTKLLVYKEIAEIGSGAELKKCMAELEDRFGSVPDPVYNLFLLVRLKLLFAPLDLASVIQTYHEFRIIFHDLSDLDSDDIATLMREFGNRRFEFVITGALEMRIVTGDLSYDKALLFAIKVLAYLARYKAVKRKRLAAAADHDEAAAESDDRS